MRQHYPEGGDIVQINNKPHVRGHIISFVPQCTGCLKLPENSWLFTQVPNLTPYKPSSARAILSSYRPLKSPKMSATTRSPELDVHLYVRPRVCDLSCRHSFTLSLSIRLCEPGRVKIQTSGSILDPAATFLKGRIDIIDAESREAISRPVHTGDGNPVLPPGSSTKESSPFLTLDGSSDPDSIFEIDFSTTPETSNVGSHHFPFDVTGLQAGRQYLFKLVDSGVTWWRYGTPEEAPTSEAMLKPLEPSEGARLEFKARNMHGFRVVAALPQPPKVSISLSASSAVCHLSGSPPFIVKIAFTSHATKPLTINTDNSPLADYQAITQVFNTRTRQWVGLDYLECVTSRDDDGPWVAENFVVLEPRQPHVRSATIDLDNLSSLSNGEEYAVCLRDVVRDSELGWWSYDSVEEVLQYAGTVENSGLHYVPPIYLDLAQEIRFTAVDP